MKYVSKKITSYIFTLDQDFGPGTLSLNFKDLLFSYPPNNIN